MCKSKFKTERKVKRIITEANRRELNHDLRYDHWRHFCKNSGKVVKESEVLTLAKNISNSAPAREITLKQTAPARDVMLRQTDPAREMTLRQTAPVREMTLKQTAPARDVMLRQNDPAREMMLRQTDYRSSKWSKYCV